MYDYSESSFSYYANRTEGWMIYNELEANETKEKNIIRKSYKILWLITKAKRKIKLLKKKKNNSSFGETVTELT